MIPCKKIYFIHYLLSGWNKWYNSNGKYKTLPTSKHMNFLTINGI